MRTLRTAEHILKDIQVHQDDRLYEKFYGPYEGASEQDYKHVKKLEEIDNSGPTKKFIDKFKFTAHADMESMSDVHHRLINFLKEMPKKHPGENVLITTHNGVMKALFIAAAASEGFDIDYRSFDLGNASIIVLEIDDCEMKVLGTRGIKYREKK